MSNDKTSQNTKETLIDKSEDVAETWRKWTLAGVPLDFKSGQTIAYAGHIIPGVYIVTSGQVKLTAALENPSSGIIPTHCPVGLASMITGSPFPYSLVAVSDATVIFVSKEVIL